MNENTYTRSYTNKKGEQITVTEDHLKAAKDIKIELQKASPSGRCSWSQLVKLMKESGFYNAENSEGYRCLIKDYQKKIGELPSLEKHADIVSSKKIDAIKSLVGELNYAKRDAQNQFRELNKVKRNIIDSTILIENVSESIKDIDLDSFDFSYHKPLSQTKNAAVVSMADWHIGLKEGGFDYNIAKSRIRQYADEVIHYCNKFDISDVKVLGIGDLVEGAYMRPQQAFNIEFTYSEQITKATECVTAFLIMLAEKLNVTYLGSICGNHSRMYDKSAVISGDSSENIIDENVKLVIRALDNERIMIDNKKESNSDISFEVNNRVIKAVHGDMLSKTEKNKINKFISSDNTFYDVLLFGHLHNYTINEENNDRLAIGTGCLPGSTNYSRSLGFSTKPSQTMIVFEGDKILPLRIALE